MCSQVLGEKLLNQCRGEVFLFKESLSSGSAVMGHSLEKTIIIYKIMVMLKLLLLIIYVLEEPDRGDGRGKWEIQLTLLGLSQSS